jgi:hypothetical protein
MLLDSLPGFEAAFLGFKLKVFMLKPAIYWTKKGPIKKTPIQNRMGGQKSNP